MFPRAYRADTGIQFANLFRRDNFSFFDAPRIYNDYSTRVDLRVLRHRLRRISTLSRRCKTFLPLGPISFVRSFVRSNASERSDFYSTIEFTYDVPRAYVPRISALRSTRYAGHSSQIVGRSFSGNDPRICSSHRETLLRNCLGRRGKERSSLPDIMVDCIE